MAAKLCPSCGATTLPGGRFCRVCGAPLKRPDAPADGGGGVSPGARTVPLSNEARPTKGMGTEDPHGPVINTSKVKRAEMDEMLRRPPRPVERVSADLADESKTTADDIHRSAPPTNELTPPPEAPSQTREIPAPAAAATSSKQARAGARTRRLWPVIVGLLVFMALAAGLIVFLNARRSEPVFSNTSNAPPPAPVDDRKRLVDEQLAEAMALLAAGQTTEAIARLRSVIELDPLNAEARVRLGEALEKSGDRQAAMEEYRIATRNDQNHAEAWRSLASAQLAEGLFKDSAESYRRLIALKGEAEVDDNTWLDYAQALILAGHTEEARAIYQRVAASSQPDAASKAKQQLAQLPLMPSANANANANTQATPRDPRADQTENHNAPAQPTPPQPTPSAPAAPTPSPTVQPTPAPQPTPANDNRAPVTDADAYYERGMNIVRGRDLKALPRAELLQALEYFQRALGGTRRAEAARQIQILGREYDRRKNQSLP
jgi:tetratricopeptide (TPR) repeat protein